MTQNDIKFCLCTFISGAMYIYTKKYNYPENIVDQELEKVKSSESSRITNKKDKCVCLVATYHPLLQNIDRIFHRHLDLLYTD